MSASRFEIGTKKNRGQEKGDVGKILTFDHTENADLSPLNEFPGRI
jgi:hypothetical protein